MKSAAQKYKASSIQSASREKLLLMMYEGAIKFTKISIAACEQKNLAEKGMAITRVYDIILELNNTLDHKIGGEIAKNLEQLYMYMTERLTKANVTNDVGPLKEVLKILETLNEGWRQAVEKIKRGEAHGTSD